MAMLSSSKSTVHITCKFCLCIGIQGASSLKKVDVLGILDLYYNSSTARRYSVKTKAALSNRNIKPKSVVCADCDGNGAVLCFQCKGSRVNSIDLFNGQFKDGDSGVLCGGRKKMLCGNCNGAGFVGGFISSFDEQKHLTCIT